MYFSLLSVAIMLALNSVGLNAAPAQTRDVDSAPLPQNSPNASPSSIDGTQTSSARGGLPAQGPQVTAQPIGGSGLRSRDALPADSRQVAGAGSPPFSQGQVSVERIVTRGNAPLAYNQAYGPGYGPGAGQALPANYYSPYAYNGYGPPSEAYYLYGQGPQTSYAGQYPNGVSSTYFWRESSPVYRTYTVSNGGYGTYAR